MAIESGNDGNLVVNSRPPGLSSSAYQMIGYDAFGENRNEQRFHSFNFFARGELGSTTAPNSTNRRWLAVVDGSTQTVLYNSVLPDFFVSLSDDQVSNIRAAVNAAELPEEMESFSSWAVANVSDTTQRGENDDPDRDGMSNLLEYAYGTNPELADSEQGPRIVVQDGQARLRYQRNIMAQVTPLAIMAGNDLSSETLLDTDGLEEVGASSSGVESVTVTLPPQESRYFLRLSTRSL